MVNKQYRPFLVWQARFKLWPCKCCGCCSVGTLWQAEVHGTRQKHFILLTFHINMYKYLMGWSREHEARLSSVIPSDKRRGNGCKSKYKNFHFNMRTNVFTERMDKHWDKMPSEAVESSCLEISKSSWIQSWATCCS